MMVSNAVSRKKKTNILPAQNRPSIFCQEDMDIKIFLGIEVESTTFDELEAIHFIQKASQKGKMARLNSPTWPIFELYFPAGGVYTDPPLAPTRPRRFFEAEPPLAPLAVFGLCWPSRLARLAGTALPVFPSANEIDFRFTPAAWAT